MSLEIQKVEYKGDSEKERLVMRVLADTNTKDYVVMDTTFDTDGEISNIGRRAYKFSPKDVKRDDLVILYTRSKKTTESGASVEHPAGSQNEAHFFFWDREASVWNEGGDRCTLLEVKQSKPV